MASCLHYFSRNLVAERFLFMVVARKIMESDGIAIGLAAFALLIVSGSASLFTRARRASKKASDPGCKSAHLPSQSSFRDSHDVKKK
jgi:hypothetical protein